MLKRLAGMFRRCDAGPESASTTARNGASPDAPMEAISIDGQRRRRALGAMAATAAAGAALPVPAATLGATDGYASFAQIAFTLAGVATVPPILLDACTAEFERAFGREALVAFVRSCSALDAQALAAPLPDATMEQQARWIMNFLYTGEVVRNGKREAVWYPWCLAWQATRFAKPPGVCGGAFGWWTAK